MTKVIELYQNLRTDHINMNILRLPISGNAFRLYAYLTARSQKKHVCWVGQRTMMNDLNVGSFTSISKWIRELDQHNLIKRIQTEPRARTYYCILDSFVDQKTEQLRFKFHQDTINFFKYQLKMTDYEKHILRVSA